MRLVARAKRLTEPLRCFTLKATRQSRVLCAASRSGPIPERSRQCELDRCDDR